MNTTVIQILPEQLRSDFPEFSEMTDEQIISAAKGVPTYISNVPGQIGLDLNIQVRGNYLACCHSLFLQQNPDAARTVALASASEGDVSASFKQFKNWFEYALALSPYGVELLAILSLVRPPVPRRPVSPFPYYRGGYGPRF